MAALGKGGAQDPVPGQRGEARLGALQDDPGDDRPGGHLGDLVEEVVDPVEGRHAEQLEHGRGAAATPPSQSAMRRGDAAAAASAVPAGTGRFHGGTLASAAARRDAKIAPSTLRLRGAVCVRREFEPEERADCSHADACAGDRDCGALVAGCGGSDSRQHLLGSPGADRTGRQEAQKGIEKAKEEVKKGFDEAEEAAKKGVEKQGPLEGRRRRHQRSQKGIEKGKEEAQKGSKKARKKPKGRSKKPKNGGRNRQLSQAASPQRRWSSLGWAGCGPLSHP